MIRVEPYRPFHLKLLIAQGVQPAYVGRISYVPGLSDRLQEMGPALTAFDRDRVLCVGGMIPMGPKLGHVWAALAAEAGAHMLALHRATERFMSTLQPQRLEATVEQGFRPGCRWLELMGFECETPNGMRRYGEDGATHLLFARVR